VRAAWLVYGDLGQPTGGYIYDRLVVDGLRASGDEVAVVDPRTTSLAEGAADVVVGDALCVAELESRFEAASVGSARVLLVHHMPSWEIERKDAAALRDLERRVVAVSDVAVATGEATAARLAREHPGLRVEVVVPGADRLGAAAPAVAPRPGGPVTLLFVGSLVPRKRVLLLLEAFEPLAGPGVSLVLVGDPSRDPEYARRVAARVSASPALRATVVMVGVASDDAVARAMVAADALVLPSSLEGYGMALTEGLHAGLPVVASREVAEAAGVVGHAAVAILGDPPAWTGTLAGLIGDRALRHAMRRAALASALPRWNGTIEAFRAALTRAASLRGDRSRATGPSR
jgi:glycosyltransferase involved in cell wall biosynthesis